MNDKKISIAGTIFLSLGSLFLLVLCVSTIKSWDSGRPQGERAEITVQGSGEVSAVPDTATFSFSVIESAKTLKDAQDMAASKTNKALVYLKDAGIADKDVQTSSYDISPQYAQDASGTICYGCPNTKHTIVGYQASEMITVKVRDTAKAGGILSGIGGLDVQNISSLSLTTDDTTGLARQAREKAIADAKSKAQALAQDLGVRLVRITSYSDSGNPMPYSKGMAALDAAALPTVPNIAAGENTTTANVTITYEIQ